MFFQIKKIIKLLMPEAIIAFYHLNLVLWAAVYYRFPARQLYVIGVTGTKGKTTTIELINAILETAGKKTAIASTLRFKIDSETKRNTLKMTMPGRFFLQKFLAQSKTAGCHYVLIEMTSEGTKQFRHKFTYLNMLIFTGLTPEHIESHGSYDNYVAAKLKIAQELEFSPKDNRAIIVNTDSKEAEKFLAINVPQKITYGKKSGQPYTINDLGIAGIEFSFAGEVIKSQLIGEFNLYNLLAAATVGKFLNFDLKIIKSALENFSGVPGRMEEIKPDDRRLTSRLPFKIIVDYAHTPESLDQVYKTYGQQTKICVLGGAGGGRDRWKRPLLGSIADTYCEKIIITNEDPYDEDPLAIIEDIKKGIKRRRPEIILDRRAAIKKAITSAKKDEVVIITGKGTDPYIMEAAGQKTPWSDAAVAREELTKFLSSAGRSPTPDFYEPVI